MFLWHQPLKQAACIPAQNRKNWRTVDGNGVWGVRADFGENLLHCGLAQRFFAVVPVAALILASLLCAEGARAVTPESPEVRALVSKALNYLEKAPEERLGGKCLIALAFLKDGKKDHPRIAEAVEACRKEMAANSPDSVLDVYSNGLAIIFLCELGGQKYSREVEWYLGRLKARQKPHGGWGYQTYETGDTSQTQYGTLSYWEAHRRGFLIDGTSLENVADWLMKTQDPNGCWGYQGQVSPSSGRIEQSETNCSMLSAGLGSAYICADLLDAAPVAAEGTDEPAGDDESIPEVLRRVAKQDPNNKGQKIRARRINTTSLVQAIDQAQTWMKNNYTIDIGPKVYYYLYAMERFRSFQEAFNGESPPEPSWYNDGYQFLKEKQTAEGSWQGFCGDPCDTAFSVLFLLRSTQKSIRAKLGEGTLLAGRGLPRNLSKAKMVRGQVLVEQVHTKVEELLSMIDGGDDAALDELARDPRQLIVEKVDEKSARRLQQLVRGGEPEVRLLATRALGRSGNLDYVPSLLYALTDPDRRVVLEAREGLKFISRDFNGFGPPDDFTDQQRFSAVEAWKNWYLALRPNAVLEK